MTSKLLPIFLLALLLGSQTPASAAQQSQPQISGTTVNGLRLVMIGPDITDNHIIIYRGDYIQPALASLTPFEINIPELNIKKQFPVKGDTKPYVKMKKAGRYAFTAGEYSGFFEVLEYEAARYSELSAAEATQIMKNIQPLLLDVRTPGEYQSGHIDGSQLLPLQVLQQQIASLKEYKDQEILIYCATGNRSTVASRILIENGFNKVYNLRYGIADWYKKGYPVTR